jgi:hypothetical protein
MIIKQSLVEELREQALSDGMTNLKQDGIYKRGYRFKTSNGRLYRLN